MGRSRNLSREALDSLCVYARKNVKYCKEIPLSAVKQNSVSRRRKQRLSCEQNRDALTQIQEAGYHYNRLAAQTSLKPVQARA